MKKLLLFIAVIGLSFGSCSKDDAGCTEKVWGINNTDNTYFLIVGENSTDALPIEVSQEVANYYSGRLSANERCYEGLNVAN